MKVWVLQSRQGRLHGDVHRESAEDCPGLLKGGADGDELVLLDVEDVPARHPVCRLANCFAGLERAGQLVRGREPAPAKFEPFEPTKRVQLKPATRGSRQGRRAKRQKATSTNAFERPLTPPPPPEPTEPAVEVGSSVTFEFLDSGETKTLKLVEGAAQISAGEISAGTPYGKAMLGAAEGDRVTVELPSRKREVKVLSFSSD